MFDKDAVIELRQLDPTALLRKFADRPCRPDAMLAPEYLPVERSDHGSYGRDLMCLWLLPTGRGRFFEQIKMERIRQPLLSSSATTVLVPQS